MNLYTKQQLRNLLDIWDCKDTELPKANSITYISFPVTHEVPLILCSKTKMKATYGGPLYAVSYHQSSDSLTAQDTHMKTVEAMQKRTE